MNGCLHGWMEGRKEGRKEGREEGREGRMKEEKRKARERMILLLVDYSKKQHYILSRTPASVVLLASVELLAINLNSVNLHFLMYKIKGFA